MTYYFIMQDICLNVLQYVCNATSVRVAELTQIIGGSQCGKWILWREIEPAADMTRRMMCAYRRGKEYCGGYWMAVPFLGMMMKTWHADVVLRHYVAVMFSPGIYNATVS